MRIIHSDENRPVGRSKRSWLVLGLACLLIAAAPAPGNAQRRDDRDQAGKLDQAAQMAAEAVAAEEPAPKPQPADPPPVAPLAADSMNTLDLLAKGGPLMIPIGILSLLVVAFGLERLIGLRRRKILPRKLIAGLNRLTGEKGAFDPRQVYRLCQQYPSTAATVVRAMILKLGRPPAEIEHAVAEAREREASRLYSNIRWLNLAAGVAPLLGLLGTVQGMIQAFFVTANQPTGVNRASHLAEGIYIALVTTFAGLCVAIPAAVLAHFFEGRIQTLFRELDETLLNLLPHLERYEGRLKVSRDQLEATLQSPAKVSPHSEDLRRPVPAATAPASSPK